MSTSIATQLWLVRHGRTPWAASGQHTGRTDIALDEVGIAQARALAPMLAGLQADQVVSSPLQRAWRTAELAGFAGVALDDRLMEWDYGAMEGRTTPEIREERPGWVIWNDGVTGGESIAEVAARVDAVITDLRAAGGTTLLFAHGHLLRILTARWIGADPTLGRALALDPATVSLLGYEREQPVIRMWNRAPDPRDTFH